MTKNFTFYTTLLSLLISLLPAFSFAQNKLQIYQVSGNTTSYTSSNVPYILIGKVFFPTSKKSFSFQNVNTTFETVFPKKRVAKMSYSGGMEKEEVESEYSSTTVLYKNVYENIDVQVAGRDENAIFSLIVHPYGKLNDIVFQISNGKNWQNASPTVWQNIDGKKQNIKSYFDVNDNSVSIKCADFDAFEDLIIEFPATPEAPVALSKK